MLINAGIISPVLSIRLRGDRYKAKFSSVGKELLTSDSCWERTSICSFTEDTPQQVLIKETELKYDNEVTVFAKANQGP